MSVPRNYGVFTDKRPDACQSLIWKLDYESTTLLINLRDSNQVLSAKKEKSDDPQSRMTDELRELQSELAQLYELDELERGNVAKLVSALKLLQPSIEVTIPINHEALGRSFSYFKDAYLASDAVVVLVEAEGSIISKPLSQFSPENILSIVQDCTPKITRLVLERRKAVAARVHLVEKMLSELKKAEATLKPSRPDMAELDMVQSSISGE